SVSCMTSAEVRSKLAHALRLDLIGPEPGEPQAGEVLAVPPSRWYLTGFLVPWSAPVHQKVDEDDAQGDFGFAEPSSGADDEEKDDEPPAARRGHFPSSIGLSVLVPEDATQIRVTASWGDYTPREVGPKPDIEWLRQEFTRTVAISLKAKRAEPAT